MSVRESAWYGVSLKPVAERPVFRISPPPYVTGEIVEFVRGFVVAGRQQVPHRAFSSVRNDMSVITCGC